MFDKKNKLLNLAKAHVKASGIDTTSISLSNATKQQLKTAYTICMESGNIAEAEKIREVYLKKLEEDN